MTGSRLETLFIRLAVGLNSQQKYRTCRTETEETLKFRPQVGKFCGCNMRENVLRSLPVTLKLLVAI